MRPRAKRKWLAIKDAPRDGTEILLANSQIEALGRWEEEMHGGLPGDTGFCAYGLRWPGGWTDWCYPEADEQPPLDTALL